MADCPTDLREFAWSYLWRLCSIVPATPTIPHPNAVNAVEFSPTANILASASGNTIMLWHTATRKIQATLEGHTGTVLSLAFSPDGRTLASGGNDGTVRLWNMILRKQVAVLEGHGSSVRKIAFSPDGQTLASTSLDHTIRLWRATGKGETRSQESLH